MISLALNSIVEQSRIPDKLVLVNDHSTDNTLSIMKEYAGRYEWISVIDRESSEDHLPGSKVIEAFYEGFSTLDDEYDIICKFDADIILPQNYFEEIIKLFKEDSSLGITGGILYITKNDEWVYEPIASKEHVRGPIKAYRKACFKDIGGLRKSVGWDTLDVLLAHYNDWNVMTDHELQVKHLKPTGTTYTRKARFLQGMALYKMRYGIVLAVIALLKGAGKRKNMMYFIHGFSGFLKALFIKEPFLVSKNEGEFIRRFRWTAIKSKIFG